MIVPLIIGVVGIFALGVVIFTRDSSALWIMGLVAAISAFFGVAFYLSSSPILLLGVLPFSIYISWLARDELLPGRPWFVLLSVIGICMGAVFFVRSQLAIGYAFLAVSLCAGAALSFSYRPRWAKKRGAWESKV